VQQQQTQPRARDFIRNAQPIEMPQLPPVDGVGMMMQGMQEFQAPAGSTMPSQAAAAARPIIPMPKSSEAQQYVEDQNRKRMENDFFPMPIRKAVSGFAHSVDKLLTNNPVGQFVNRFSQGAGNAVGVDTQAAGAAPIESTGNRAVDVTADIAGNIAGVLTNPSNLSQGLVSAPYKIGKQITQRFAPKAPQLVQRGIEGAVAGAIQGGAISGIRGETDVKELATNIGIGAATGAVADPLMSLLGRGISKLFNRNNLPDSAVQEVLALPAPKQRGNPNRANTPDVIVDADTRPVAPLGLPEPDILPPTSGRIQRATNPFREKFESLIGEAKRIESERGLTPGREAEELESIWSSMAGPNDPSLDELINLAYKPNASKVTRDSIRTARQTQQMREAAGAPPVVRSQADRYQQGVRANAAPITQKVGRAPSANAAEVLPATTKPPERPRVDVTREVETEQILQSVQKPRVRDRVYNYLDEAEQAARKRIAGRRGRLSANPLGEWTDYGIIGASKMGKGTIKLADWTEEMVKEFGEEFRPRAAKVYRESQEFIRQQERKATKQGQAAAEFNAGEGDATTAATKISREAAKRKVPFAKRWEKVRTQFVDDLAPLEGVEKRVRGKLASAEDSLYKSARLYKGTPERANQIIKQRLAPVVNGIEKAGMSTDDLGLYTVARHAKDVNAAGYKSGFTDAEINDVLQKFGTPEMEAARMELVNINRDMLKELADSGVVSKNLRDVLNDRWQNYVPLFRDMDDEMVGFSAGNSGALANVASPIKALKGSEKKVIDPLENMVKNIFQSVSASERNKVATQLAKLAKVDTEANFIRKLEPDEQVGRKNVVNVKVDGENVKYEVEPEVYKALLNMDQEASTMLVNILSKPASVLRAGATLTPEFSLRNPMRDVLQAFVTSNSGFNPITDFTAGLVSSISKGKLYQQWLENLGGYGNIISQDRNLHRQALDKVLKQPASKKFTNIVNPNAWLNVLRAISDTTESATKVGEFRAALRQGQTPQEAAYRSRDVMDFARAGSGIRQANRMVAFLNASIQGKSKLIRAIKENPIGTTARMFTAVTLPTVGIFALNNSEYISDAQRDIIKEAPDWQKDTFWLIAVPGTEMVARIPKPFDIAPIFANLPEKALEFTKENDPKAFDGFVRRTLADGALPYQLSGLLPIIEGMADYSFFREGSIVPQREQGLQTADQYDPVRTTETAKFLAAGARKLTGDKGAFKNFGSPRIMDSTIKGFTAGLGTYATSAIDTILEGEIFGKKVYPSILDKPDAPEKRMEQRPLAKAFLIDPLQGGKSMDKFYSEREKLQKQKASAALNEKPFEKDDLLKFLNDVSSQMSEYNTAIREIEKSKLSAKEKRDKIEPYIKQRNKLAQDAVKRGNLR